MDTFFCLIGFQIRQLKTRVFRISNRAFCSNQRVACVCVCVADPDLPQDVAESQSQLSCQLQTVHVQQVLVKQTLTMAHIYSLDRSTVLRKLCMYPLCFNVSLSMLTKGGEIQKVLSQSRYSIVDSQRGCGWRHGSRRGLEE